MAICKSLDIITKIEYLEVITIDGPATIWSGETATYDIQVENTGNVAVSGTLELYTHNAVSELIILNTMAIPELSVNTIVSYTLEADSTGLSDGTYSVCAKTNFE